ncbi:MAG: heparinase II/III-family protein [Bacteroidales bacterium]|nr:heparinase II/III-family protein [Bacteroidales bacterium]
MSLPCTLSAQRDKTAAQQRDESSIGKNILNRKPEHPYLLFDRQSKQAILDRVRNEPEYVQIMDLLLQEGRRVMLNTTEPQKVFNDPASRYYQLPSWEAYVGFYLSGSQLLAFLYQMTGDEDYAKKAFHYADKLCELEGWAAGAHRFDIIYPRVWPYGAKDDQVVFSFDISTGDCALGMALVYDWIYPVMNKAQRDRIRNGLLENAILPVRGNYEYYWWAEAYKCNWAAICHGGLGLAALALLTEDPNLTDVVDRSCEGFQKMLANYGDDNGWAEGRSYSFYGIRDAIAFPAAIKRLTGNKVNIFDTPGWKHPADFALFGLTGAFNDGAAAGPVGFSYTYNKLIEESRDETAMYYLQTYLSGENRSRSMWELIWPRPTNVKAVKPAVASKYFPSIDWAFMRKDFGKEYMQVAVKCAPANDPHHGHLDAGSLILTWNDDVIVGEVEQRFYDQFFFNDVRFDYLYVRSIGHNVVQVNDEEQFIAKRKDQPWLEGVGGKIDKFVATPEYDYTIMDPTNAYPGKNLKKWKRSVVLDKENNIVLILDRVECTKGDKIDLLFHPAATATINENRTASLIGKVNRTRMEMQPLVNAPYELTLQTQYTVRVVKDSPVQAIPCLFTTLKAPDAATVIGTVFYPDKLKANDSFVLDEKGKKPVIRYTVDGKTYAYEFDENQVKRL